MSKLDAILKDKSQFKDDLEVTINGEKYALGDLRTLNDSMGGELTQRLETERKNLAAEQAKLQQGQNELIAAFQALQSQPTGQQPKPEDWENDSFYTPVVKTRAELKAELNKVQEQQQQVAKALALMVKYYGDVRAQDQFRYVRQNAPAEWQKKLSYDELSRIAAEKRLVDAGGFPDIERAYDEWSKPLQIEQIRAEEREKAQAEAQQRQQQVDAGLPRPGSGFRPNNPNPQWKSASDMTAAMANDPEVLAEINSLIGQA